MNLHDPLKFEPIIGYCSMDGRDLWDAFQAFYPGAQIGGVEDIR